MNIKGNGQFSSCKVTTGYDFLKNRFYDMNIEVLKNVTENSNLTNQLPQLLHLTAQCAGDL